MPAGVGSQGPAGHACRRGAGTAEPPGQVGKILHLAHFVELGTAFLQPADHMGDPMVQEPPGQPAGLVQAAVQRPGVSGQIQCQDYRPSIGGLGFPDNGMVHLGRQLPMDLPEAVSRPVAPQLMDLCIAAARLGVIRQDLELRQIGKTLRRIWPGQHQSLRLPHPAPGQAKQTQVVIDPGPLHPASHNAAMAGGEGQRHLQRPGSSPADGLLTATALCHSDAKAAPGLGQAAHRLEPKLRLLPTARVPRRDHGQLHGEHRRQACHQGQHRQAPQNHQEEPGKPSVKKEVEY